MIDILSHAERHCRVCAIDRTRRRIDQMLDLVVPTSFQNVQKPRQVRTGIGVRMLECVAHARLCGEIDDAGWPLVSENPFHRKTVRKVDLDEVERWISAQQSK